MQRSNFPFPAWANHNMLRAVSSRIYGYVFTPPSLVHLEAEARSQGSWQFFVVRPQSLEMERYLALALTCQAQKAAVDKFLFASTNFELTIVPSASPGFTRFQDPHSIIGGLRRLDIWLTPEMGTRSRTDCVVRLDVDRQGRVSRCTVDMQFISENTPMSATNREMSVERKTVHRIILRDLRNVYRNKTWGSALLARLVTVLHDAKTEFGIIEGKDWMTDGLGWLNYVNLNGDDDEDMEDSEDEEMKESDNEEVQDQRDNMEDGASADGMEEVAENADVEDAEMAEEDSDESEGSEMSVDDVQGL